MNFSRAARTRALVATATMLFAGALVGPSAPASADSWDLWRFEGPADGMPTTDVAARTIEDVWLRVVHGRHVDQVRAEVTLAAMPEEGTEGDLRLGTGRRDISGICYPLWEVVRPTSSAVSNADGDPVLYIDYPVNRDDWKMCVWVEITASGAPETVYDRWEGLSWTSEHGDPAGQVRITDVQVPDVRAHQWFPIRVSFKSVGNRLSHVTLTARGRDVRSVRTVVRRPSQRKVMTARVWVKLRTEKPRRVVLTATPHGHLFIAFEGVRKVWVDPR